MKLLRIILLASVACLFCSCNTFIGMGKDIQSLGHGMVKAGHKNSNSVPQAPEAAQTPPAGTY